MSPEEFAPLVERAIGKHAATWEIDRVFSQISEFDARHVIAVVSEFREPPRTSELIAAIRWRAQREQSRRKALDVVLCEHGRRDAPFDPCPDCRPLYQAAAKRGADRVRQALKEAKNASQEATG